jgi:hypothetical protein
MTKVWPFDPLVIVVAIASGACSVLIVRALRNRSASPTTMRTAVLGGASWFIGFAIAFARIDPFALIGVGMSLIGTSYLTDLDGWARFNMRTSGSLKRWHANYGNSWAIMSLGGVVVAVAGPIMIGYAFFPWGKGGFP